jgi:oligopeptidase B
VAEQRPHCFTVHGQEISDPYAWLEGEPSFEADVSSYIEAENAYYEKVMGHLGPVVDGLYEELRSRIREDEESVPVRDGPYLYSWRYGRGEQYRTWLRRAAHGGPEEVILDEPARAVGSDFYSLGGLATSPDHRLDGSERYTLLVKDLETGRLLPDRIEETMGDPVWSADGRGFVYVALDGRWRPCVVRFHLLGTPVAQDVTVFEEPNPGFFVDVSRTQSRRFVAISTGDNITTEVLLLPTASPTDPPLLVCPRRPGHEYYVDHAGGTLYVRTNDLHPNFRIVTAPEFSPGPGSWRELVPASERSYLTGMVALGRHLVIEERTDGLDRIRVLSHGGADHVVPFDEPVYAAFLDENREPDTDTIRIRYESMVTPVTILDYEIPTRTMTVRKVQEIPSGYDPGLYACERIMAPARDGTLVPVTVLTRRDFVKDGTGRVHLYGYGAYGNGIAPGFSTERLSLLDRGFAYAIAHIRGGDEMGSRWYEAGRLFARKNTFHDFIDVALQLIERGFTRPGRISISGGSAGGELMGYVVNSDPDLWCAVVAHAPFVDVLNSMLDKDLPLTPIDWPIWGNPIESKEAFEYIRSYSPYDNVRPQAYPPMMVTAAINDPRVTYWEPVKWVAKLRATKTDQNLLLLKTNMVASHRGRSGRFDRLRETAEEFAFILVACGLA